MAKFNGLQLTTAGEALLAESVSGKALTFTYVRLGDGNAVGDAKSYTMLTNPKLSAPVVASERNGATVTVTAEISNADVDEGFFIREIGLFARTDGNEILYAYASAGVYADYMPDKTANIDMNTVKITVAVSSKATINVTINNDDSIKTVNGVKPDNTGNVILNAATQEYIQSRGQNLVTNGTGLLGNNYNFSSFDFDASEAYGAGGSFTTNKLSRVFQNDEYIPVNPDQKYRLSMYVKQKKLSTDSALNVCYAGLCFFDVDKKNIDSSHSAFTSGTTTTLTKDINNGDTVVYLTSVANWDNVATSDERHTFIIWNYKNSGGYQYPVETYSRNTYAKVYSAGGVNSTNNTITLNKAWSYGTIPAGTSISEGTAGGSYHYIAITNTLIPENWTYYSGISCGTCSTIDYSSQFRPGTAFVKLVFLVNYDSKLPANTMYFSNVSFGIDNQPHVINTTLRSASWSNGDYTLSDTNISANDVITIMPAMGITTEQYVALSSAQIIGNSQGVGYIGLRALGMVPKIDIPITLTIQGAN